jgi:hypothetical protein
MYLEWQLVIAICAEDDGSRFCEQLS